MSKGVARAIVVMELMLLAVFRYDLIAHAINITKLAFTGKK